MSLIAAGACDIGRVRRTNQHAIYLNVEKRLFLVADGMGGHNGGDIASAMAVKYIPEYIISHKSNDPIDICKKSILYANDKIKKMGEENGDYRFGLLFQGTLCVSGQCWRLEVLSYKQ